MKLSLPPRLVEKLIWVPRVIWFCKSFIPSYAFGALLCRNWPFLAPNRLTLLITLISISIWKVDHGPQPVGRWSDDSFAPFCKRRPEREREGEREREAERDTRRIAIAAFLLREPHARLSTQQKAELEFFPPKCSYEYSSKQHILRT